MFKVGSSTITNSFYLIRLLLNNYGLMCSNLKNLHKYCNVYLILSYCTYSLFNPYITYPILFVIFWGPPDTNGRHPCQIREKLSEWLTPMTKSVRKRSFLWFCIMRNGPDLGISAEPTKKWQKVTHQNPTDWVNQQTCSQLAGRTKVLVIIKRHAHVCFSLRVTKE